MKHLAVVFATVMAVGCAHKNEAKHNAEAHINLSNLLHLVGAPRGPFELEDINEETVASAMAYLDEQKQLSKNPVVLRMNSYGGSVFAGFKLAQHIERLGVPVRCEVDGAAYSMAAFILQSCTTRVATRRSSIMMHEPSLSGEVSGNRQTFFNFSEELRVLTNMLAVHMAARMGIPVEDLLAKMAGGKAYWLTADEALRAHVLDRVN